MAQGNTLNLEDARIGYRNFEGNEGKYNKAGDRNFVVFLDDDQAKELEAEGWNVKWPKANDEIDPEEDERQPYLQVSVAYNNFPPTIVLVTDGNATRLSEEEVGMLDWADIVTSDIVIRPYYWTVNGNSGIKAYLKALYVTIETDAFASKYENL